MQTHTAYLKSDTDPDYLTSNVHYELQKLSGTYLTAKNKQTPSEILSSNGEGAESTKEWRKGEVSQNANEEEEIR